MTELLLVGLVKGDELPRDFSRQTIHDLSDNNIMPNYHTKVKNHINSLQGLLSETENAVRIEGYEWFSISSCCTLFETFVAGLCFKAHIELISSVCSNRIKYPLSKKLESNLRNMIKYSEEIPANNYRKVTKATEKLTLLSIENSLKWYKDVFSRFNLNITDMTWEVFQTNFKPISLDDITVVLKDMIALFANKIHARRILFWQDQNNGDLKTLAGGKSLIEYYKHLLMCIHFFAYLKKNKSLLRFEVYINEFILMHLQYIVKSQDEIVLGSHDFFKALGKFSRSMFKLFALDNFMQKYEKLAPADYLANIKILKSLLIVSIYIMQESPLSSYDDTIISFRPNHIITQDKAQFETLLYDYFACLLGKFADIRSDFEQLIPPKPKSSSFPNLTSIGGTNLNIAISSLGLVKNDLVYYSKDRLGAAIDFLYYATDDNCIFSKKCNKNHLDLPPIPRKWYFGGCLIRLILMERFLTMVDRSVQNEIKARFLDILEKHYTRSHDFPDAMDVQLFIMIDCFGIDITTLPLIRAYLLKKFNDKPLQNELVTISIFLEIVNENWFQPSNNQLQQHKHKHSAISLTEDQTARFNSSDIADGQSISKWLLTFKSTDNVTSRVTSKFQTLWRSHYQDMFTKLLIAHGNNPQFQLLQSLFGIAKINTIFIRKFMTKWLLNLSPSPHELDLIPLCVSSVNSPMVPNQLIVQSLWLLMYLYSHEIYSESCNDATRIMYVETIEQLAALIFAIKTNNLWLSGSTVQFITERTIDIKNVIFDQEKVASILNSHLSNNLPVFTNIVAHLLKETVSFNIKSQASKNERKKFGSTPRHAIISMDSSILLELLNEG